MGFYQFQALISGGGATYCSFAVRWFSVVRFQQF